MASTSPPTSPKRDGVNSSAKSKLTRKRILDAAAEALSTRGYAGMRLSDVAIAAELRAPAIYYYFDSREDLIEEVMWAGIADMRDKLSATIDDLPLGTEPMDKILAAVDLHLRHELEISAYTTAAIRNAGQIPKELRTRQLAAEAEYGRIWQSILSEARDAGVIRSDLDPYMCQMFVMGSLNWAAEWWKPRRGSIDKVVDNAQAFVRSALSPHQAEL
ncbi:TetR/AcrR family transcriptional regulator [Dietzia maris]|uniref:TetR/AcrR family transcriptional regulator n=1 Tax=Dietzia maris TaxID=37915 RepID=UPI0037CB7F19